MVDSQLQEALGFAGGVLIEGVRGCGKTRTAREHAASWVNIDDDDPQIAGALAVEPTLLLQGEYPALSMSGSLRRACGIARGDKSTLLTKKAYSSSLGQQHHKTTRDDTAAHTDLPESECDR